MPVVMTLLPALPLPALPLLPPPVPAPPPPRSPLGEHVLTQPASARATDTVK